MKTRNIVTLAVVAALGMTACDNEDIHTGNFPGDGVIRFNVNVNQAQTRASYTTETIDNFGVCVTNSASSTYSYDNVKVTKQTASGSTAWNPASPMLWHNATEAVDIVAYAPFKEGSYTTATTDFPVSVNAVQTADTRESDFLICRKNVSPTSGLNAQGAVDLGFTHALSQLTVTLTFGTLFNHGGVLQTNPASQVKVDGMLLQGTCDFSKTTATVTATPATAATVTPYLSNFKVPAQKTEKAVASYSCIVPPQTIAADELKISFVLDGKTYRWASGKEFTLAENTHYTLPLTVGQDEVALSGDITISPWTDNPNAGDLITH